METGSADSYVLVEIGAERAGMPLTDVGRPFALARQARVPWAPEWVCGAVHRDGQILMVVDLARFANLGDAGPRPVVFVPYEGRSQLAFAVRAATVVTGEAVLNGGPLDSPLWCGDEHRIAGVVFHPIDLSGLIEHVAGAL